MALGLPQDELWAAHLAGKQQLLETVHVRTGLTLDPDAFTIGFARRATAYKRADLIFGDLDRLKDIAAGSGAFQFVFAGKAHPSDAEGKELIRRIYRAKKALRRELRIAYLDDYNMEIAAKMTAGVDLWLNTPQYPLEASGTSGMKAAVNGVPSLSVLDGWWTEGHIEGVTGWSIGGPRSAGAPDPGASGEMDSLYRKLQDVILPLYYKQRPGYISVMQHAIAINGAFFNTQRMLQQYVSRAYFR